VVPIIELRRRFDLPPEDSPGRRIMIVVVDGRTLGLMVDAVTEVVRVRRNAIRAAPGLLDAERAPYFLGVCEHGDRTLVLLNVKEIVASEDAIELPDAADVSQGTS
ncbi:MAG: chemotaxis protein CheW, partial [Myxococcota bacterium]